MLFLEDHLLQFLTSSLPSQKRTQSLCMQNRMSHIPNLFTQLMIQLCSKVATAEPAVKLLKGFTDILTSWAANLSYLLQITTHHRLSWANTHLVPRTTTPLPHSRSTGERH